MKIKWLAAFYCFVLITGAGSLTAKDLNLQFKDQYGKPLANLVVEISFSTEKNEERVSKPDLKSGNQSYIMDQVDKAFKPELLLIRQGDNVAFPNSDNIRHHVYSFSKAKPFELKLYSGRPTNPVTFPQHGVVTLGCNIHDSMVGFIYVAKSPSSFVTDSKGKIHLEKSKSITSITAWHPHQKLAPERPQKMDLSKLSISGVTEYSIETRLPPVRDTFGAKFKDAQ